MGCLYEKLTKAQQKDIDLLLQRYVQQHYDLSSLYLDKTLLDIHREDLVQIYYGNRFQPKSEVEPLSEVPKEYCEKQVSGVEKLIQALLTNEFNMSYDFDKQFKNERVISNLKFDFVLENGSFIEHDGIQHFMFVEKFYQSNGYTVEKGVKNDNIKNSYCLEKNIPFLRIPYIYTESKRNQKRNISDFIRYFLLKRRVPSEIIDFYAEYFPENNYADVARKLNNSLAI